MKKYFCLLFELYLQLFFVEHMLLLYFERVRSTLINVVWFSLLFGNPPVYGMVIERKKALNNQMNDHRYGMLAFVCLHFL